MLEHCPEDYEDWRVNKKGIAMSTNVTSLPNQRSYKLI